MHAGGIEPRTFGGACLLETPSLEPLCAGRCLFGLPEWTCISSPLFAMVQRLHTLITLLLAASSSVGLRLASVGLREPHVQRRVAQAQMAAPVRGFTPQ